MSAIAKLVIEAYTAYGKVVEPAALPMWERLLGKFSQAELQAAFDAHMLDSDAGRFAPMPAHIAAQLEKRKPSSSHLSADEAWAIAVQAADEESTVVWTQPIAQAWGYAREVMPDKVGARMAFKAAYERLIAALPGGAELRWFPSMGKDATRREDALARAVEQGKLSADHAAGLLPPPPVTEEGRQIAAKYLSELRLMIGKKA
jgi:hypothetical protein